MRVLHFCNNYYGLSFTDVALKYQVKNLVHPVILSKFFFRCRWGDNNRSYILYHYRLFIDKFVANSPILSIANPWYHLIVFFLQSKIILFLHNKGAKNEKKQDNKKNTSVFHIPCNHNHLWLFTVRE